MSFLCSLQTSSSHLSPICLLLVHPMRVMQSCFLKLAALCSTSIPAMSSASRTCYNSLVFLLEGLERVCYFLLISRSRYQDAITNYHHLSGLIHRYFPSQFLELGTPGSEYQHDQVPWRFLFLACRCHLCAIPFHDINKDGDLCCQIPWDWGCY